jgi:thiol-disulfide isomerase/thioredoxin
VVLKFWATWCGNCLVEMPEIKAIQQRIGAGRLVVLAVNAGQAPSEAQAFIDHIAAPFEYALDPDLTLSDAYGVYGLPLTVFIDSRGIVQAVYRGPADRVLLERLIASAVNAAPPGEIVPVLRQLSTVPRQATLSATVSAEGRLKLESKRLRCDPSYCFDAATLLAAPGVTGVARSGAQVPAVDLEFNPAAVSVDALIEGLQALIGAIPDPLYQGEIEVTVRQG